MAYCTNCGYSLSDGANFCFKCGAKINNDTESSLDVEISMSVLLKGKGEGNTPTDVFFPHLNKTQRVFIPNNIAAGQKIRLRDCGRTAPDGRKGDVYIHITDINYSDVGNEKLQLKSFCCQCGKQLSSDARFCTRCGTTVQGNVHNIPRADDEALHDMKRRAIHYYKAEDYDRAYTYCEKVLNIVPDDQSMLNLKTDILHDQSNAVLQRAHHLLDNYPYDTIKDEANELMVKATEIFPGNKNIEGLYDKIKEKIFEGLSEFVCRCLDEGDYKTANEMAEDLMESWPGDHRAEAMYKIVKEHSPRKWWR